MSVYNKSGQGIFFCREAAVYGKPYDPEGALSAFTILAADYPHWRKLDYITNEVDPVIPFIEKLKQFDIGDGKHASAIINGNIEPQDITLEMNAQGLEFLMYAIGAPAYASHGRKIVQTITTVADVASSLNDTYFLIDVIDTAVVKHYAVWFDVNSAGSAPTITGINADNVLEVDLSVGATATEVADAIEAKLEALDGVTTANNTAALIEIVVASEGAVQQARDSGAAPTGFVFAVTTMGSTSYTVTEDLTTALPSFTMHLEQQNDTSAEDIIWDCFGCVVEEVAVNVAFSDKVVTYSVTIKCPYALENTNGRATNPPPKKLIDAMSSMNALQESASNYIIQEGTTDRTPSTVEKVTLTIKNNVTFGPDVAKQYMAQAFAGVRNVTMNIVGTTTEKELFTYWQGTYALSGTDYRPTSATGLLNTEFKLMREDTYDDLQISVYNWLLLTHNFTFVDVDKAYKSVDMTFEDGSANSSGIILDATTFVSLVGRDVMVELVAA